MGRNKLRDTTIRAAAARGKLGDGDGLYLNVSASGTKAFVFVYIRGGRRRELGLGPYGAGTGRVSLAGARAKADEVRAILGRGDDPFEVLAERRAAARAATFGECADDLLASKVGHWGNQKHADQWAMTLREYAKPLRKLPVAKVATDDVVRALKPIWSTKPETASRTRGRIEAVLDYAKARGLRTGENPARWRGHLDHVLPAARKLACAHHAALPYADLPAFMTRLQGQEGASARALEFTILTAARSGEALGATWAELDLNDGVWTVPAERMKAGREHRVPLSDRALAVVRQMHAKRMGDFVFPGQSARKPLSNMAMTAVLRRMKIDGVTVHGFRSTFRDWAGEETAFPRELAEAALAHTVGDAVELAYRRGDALAKRRKMMDEWATFCGGTVGG